MNLEQARFNMVEQQIRPWDVLDQDVLDLLFEVRREEYVPGQYRALAFADMEIPLGHEEVMLTPKLEARILQEIHLSKNDAVLEIGTGSGYMTALLAYSARQVTSVDVIPEFTRMAEDNLGTHRIRNVMLASGDAAHGWQDGNQYDVIVLTGSVPQLPKGFISSLSPRGRLFAVVGREPVMRATLFERQDDYLHPTGLFETCIRPLRNAGPMHDFRF
jgi:protein-L-isoaspartate(D-aspartate) O-methyltransferase